MKPGPQSASLSLLNGRRMSALAYSRVTGRSDEYEAALANEDATAGVTIDAVQLILLGRDHHMYEWATSAEITRTAGCS